MGKVCSAGVVEPWRRALPPPPLGATVAGSLANYGRDQQYHHICQSSKSDMSAIGLSLEGPTQLFQFKLSALTLQPHSSLPT